MKKYNVIIVERFSAYKTIAVYAESTKEAEKYIHENLEQITFPDADYDDTEILEIEELK